jgi:Uma2 family endonuclease
MASAAIRRSARAIDYPTSDGKPMAETDLHRDLLADGIGTLKNFYADRPGVYVSGNLLLYYEEGDKRKHVSPDIFVVRGVGMRRREYYLLWEEGKAPEVIIEMTSKTTRREDLGKKWRLYRDTLKVKEYFLFDPWEEYLKPSMQGFRLRGGDYHPIRWVENRLPSQVLGLHLEREGAILRFYDPAIGRWLLTSAERADVEAQRAEVAEKWAEAEAKRADAEGERAEAERRRADQLQIETDRLRRELAAIKEDPSRRPS